MRLRYSTQAGSWLSWENMLKFPQKCMGNTVRTCLLYTSNKQYTTGIKSGKISPDDTEYQDGYTPESLASGSSQGDRILNVGGNQFPEYLVVILLAGIFLVLVVIAVQMMRKSKASAPAKEKGPEDQPPNKTEGQKK